MKKYSNLTVMDYSIGTVFIYANIKFTKDIEALLYDLGHNINECSYMWSDNISLNIESCH